MPRFPQPLQVTLPVGPVLAAKAVEYRPRVQASIVAIVEHQPDRVTPDRLDPVDIHPLLAGHQHPLARAVPLDLRRGRVNAQVLGGEIEGFAVGETNLQRRERRRSFRLTGCGPESDMVPG